MKSREYKYIENKRISRRGRAILRRIARFPVTAFTDESWSFSNALKYYAEKDKTKFEPLVPMICHQELSDENRVHNYLQVCFGTHIY